MVIDIIYHNIYIISFWFFILHIHCYATRIMLLSTAISTLNVVNTRNVPFPLRLVKARTQPINVNISVCACRSSHAMKLFATQCDAFWPASVVPCRPVLQGGKLSQKVAAATDECDSSFSGAPKPPKCYCRPWTRLDARSYLLAEAHQLLSSGLRNVWREENIIWYVLIWPYI